MEEIDLSYLFKFYLSKIKWVIISIVCLVLVGNVYNLITRVPLYQSSTTIVLATENKDDEKYTQSDALLNQNLVSTYSQIIKSRKVLNKVIKNKKLKYNYDKLSSAIDVSSVEDTEIIKISVKSKNKKEAIKIADAIVPVFSDEVKRIYNINNVSVVDEAYASSKPCNINYLKENMLYVLSAFILSTGVIFIIYYFDTSIKSATEIEEKCGLTILGVVPKVRR